MFEPVYSTNAMSLRAVPDTIAPTVTAAAFVFDAPTQRVTVRFSENVSASLSADDLLLFNLTTGQTVPSGNVTVAYDALANEAVFTFPGFTDGILPDGDYRATLAAANVTDAAGNPLAADLVLEFFFRQGDANHDGEVNFDDYVLIDNGFNNGLSGFGNGDFNYDGAIDFDDYVLIDLAFNSQ